MLSSYVNTDPYAKRNAKVVDNVIFVLTAIFVANLLPFGANFRDILPEPFDIFDHVSNLVVSITIAYYATILIAKLIHLTGVNRSLGLLIAKSAAFILMITMNVLFETRGGLSLVGSSTTADTIDLAHGVLGAAIGVGVVYVKQKVDSGCHPESTQRR